MREIKFRFWCPYTKIMKLPVTLYELSSHHFVPAQCFDHAMQYTGLKDKNGVPIYENDVIYIAGYGDYVAEFPFIELYEALMEDDIGEILGNTFETEKYKGTEN